MMDGWCLIQAANGLVLDIAGGEQGGKLIIFTKHGGDNQLLEVRGGDAGQQDRHGGGCHGR